jgi:hypothetical protein
LRRTQVVAEFLASGAELWTRGVERLEFLTDTKHCRPTWVALLQQLFSSGPGEELAHAGQSSADRRNVPSGHYTGLANKPIVNAASLRLCS